MLLFLEIFFQFNCNWVKIALQWCVGVCHTTMQISHSYVCICIYIYTYIHIYLPLEPPSLNPYTSRSSQSPILRSLCYIATAYQLSVLRTICVYMSMLLSHGGERREWYEWRMQLLFKTFADS